MAVAKNGSSASNTIAATDAVTSQAFVVPVGGTLLSGTATMLAGFAILSPNATPITVTSVTDSAGNTWTKVTEQASGSGWDTSAINAGVQKGSTLSIWITNNATINTSITITANFSSTTLNCVGMFTPKFTGCDTTKPLDLNASLPKVLKQTTLAHPDLTGISTTTAHIWPVSFMSMFSSNILSSIIAFNGVAADNSSSLQHNNSPSAEFLKGQTYNGPAASTAYSGVSFTATSNDQNVWHIGLVLTADTQSVNGSATGATLTATTSLSPAGSAGTTTPASGSTLTTTASLIAGTGSAPINGTASGVTLTETVTLIEGAGANTVPIDGGKIYEFTPGEVASDTFQTEDYDSIWGRGDREANGLMTFGQFGQTTIFSGFNTAFDNNYHVGLGNGPVINGNAWHGWLEFAGISIDLRGWKFIGTDNLAEEGQFALYGGSAPGVIAPQSYTANFDAFGRSQGPSHDPDSGTSLFSFEYDITPRFFIAYPHYEFVTTVGLVSDNLFCNEIWLKIAHSNLDGGDRRLTNGDPSRQVTITWSTDWAVDPDSTGGFSIPSKVLIDGVAQHPGSPTKQFTRFGSSSSITTPQSTVGAWIQFAFPRAVIPRHLMFRLATSATKESYSGATPAHYGKWHWEASDGPSGPWVAVGESGWSFHENCTYMPAPRNGSFDIDPLGEDGNGVTHWRMVLDAGPALGNFSLEQVLFDLVDVTGKAPPLTVAFTDDTDGVPATVTVGAGGSPYVVALSDGSDDGFGPLTVTNIPNPVLTVSFDDGGTFDTWSDLYPSVVVQSFVVSTGR